MSSIKVDENNNPIEEFNDAYYNLNAITNR